MRVSRGLRKPQVSAFTAAGLIAMPVALLPGHSAPTGSATASARATATATPSASPSSRGTTPPAPAGPRLSISVTDGRTAVKPGDQLTYLVSIQNSGVRDTPHLKITQTLPAGLKFVSASGHGVVAGGQVAWSAGLAAGRTETFRVVTQVTRTPARMLRLAAVACAAAQGSSRPIVCAAHLDRLPAAAAVSTTRASGSSGLPPLGYAGAGLGVLALGGVLATLYGRRIRRRRRPA
jgi:uncharacterized repeat protein (TIGR01451 family)